MAKYLQKRRRRYYAVLEIPKDLQCYFGKRRHVESLETESLSEAERLVLSRVAFWKAEFEALRTGKKTPLDILAKEWREDYAKAEAEEKEVLTSVLEDEAERIAWKDPEAAETFFKVVTGETIWTEEYIEKWLTSLDNDSKTLAMKRSDVSQFANAFPRTDQINKRAVQRWFNDLQKEQRLKVTTLRRKVSACRGYWEYLVRSGYLEREDEPFSNAVPKQGKKRKAKREDAWKPFDPAEVIDLWKLAGDWKDQQLQDIIWLGMWTGCRIEELCRLQLKHIQKDRFEIVDAKTGAGDRVVPIHNELAPVVERLCCEANDGYLIKGLTFNKYKRRSDPVGKRFGRLKTKRGFGHQHVFHSIRKTVATQLENAGVPENVAADLLGHEKTTITYGLYSGGSNFHLLQDAISKIEYPVA